jgi:hypothetical protein
VSAPSESPADAGVRLAQEYLRLVEDGRPDDAATLLTGLADARALVFAGAGFTTLARRTGRTLPTAMRAQASTRQIRLGQLRDRHRRDVEGLRTWLREAAEELVTVTRLAADARLRLGPPSSYGAPGAG